MVAWYLVNFWLWMLLVPIIAWLGHRTTTRGWGRFSLVHAASSVAIAAAQVPLRIAIFWFLCGSRLPTVHTLGQYMRGEWVDNFHFAILTYWVVLAVLRGMESRRHLRDERLCNAQLEMQLAQSQLRALHAVLLQQPQAGRPGRGKLEQRQGEHLAGVAGTVAGQASQLTLTPPGRCR